MRDKHLDALRAAYLKHITWMHEHAEKYESGKAQHLEHDGSQVVNRSQELAEEFRHRANNLEAHLNAYERLSSRGSS